MFTSLPIYRDGRVTFFADSEDPPAALRCRRAQSCPALRHRSGFVIG